ncbi:protein DYAD-like [Hibiscus syriacus]|uniref:protein DYAD-like n=1 Tax=Hibiscus syriacus TaxID=106335 RepID=UPI001923E684|nr:protein DYAD-like [Hibiscus syriacus]XP_039005151.1 protein DYAD-like [Hibiscus syriacus]XP_039005152.1 protein DYAD-like [Hibiscus syriacus]XP_039005153.1 protein DYAD-like [Hibiscus syriacus]XP_039005154.1 protein DYAD-like [Hibiscus syriacus]
MAERGVCRQVKLFGSLGDSPVKQLNGKIEEEYDEDDKNHVSCPEVKKRKCLFSSHLRKEKTARCGKQSPSNGANKGKKNKHKNSIERWSAERYNLAEESMLEIMKAEGAVYENPISRPALRMAARKLIGDTGLLDHLLKHIDGKVAPGGTDRFRRCYNTSGVMEYWLESADLANKRREAGASPFWQKPDGDPSQASASAMELKLLKEEMAKMKRDMQELVFKQQEQDQANSVEEMQKEMVKWKGKTDKRLLEFTSSLNGMQNMCKELMTWKARVEQQMLEISDSLSSLQASKQCTIFSPSTSDRWEDWLESTNLDNFQGGNLGPWLDNPELINFGQDVVQDSDLAPLAWQRPCHNPFENPVCAQDLDMINEEMDKIMSSVQDIGVPRRQGEDQANVTPDSSVTANSKMDSDNSLLLVQEMLKDLVKWKAKTKQQLTDISSVVSVLQKSRQ